MKNLSQIANANVLSIAQIAKNAPSFTMPKKSKQVNVMTIDKIKLQNAFDPNTFNDDNNYGFTIVSSNASLLRRNNMLINKLKMMVDKLQLIDPSHNVEFHNIQSETKGTYDRIVVTNKDNDEILLTVCPQNWNLNKNDESAYIIFNDDASTKIDFFNFAKLKQAITNDAKLIDKIRETCYADYVAPIVEEKTQKTENVNQNDEKNVTKKPVTKTNKKPVAKTTKTASKKSTPKQSTNVENAEIIE